MLTRAMRVIAGWFYTEPTNSARPRWELPVLCAIVLLGTVVRFWGLGSVGLHGEDEDTTALPAVHILQDGTPKFPSGMFYARAIVQSYLIAASVFAFGESEWAIRFPSAVCGVLLIALAYVIGRRFLNRGWNLVFVATVAFSPELIAVSQNARMYVFLLASLAGFTALIFRWESRKRNSDLWWAVAVMVLALQFQLLAVFAVLLFFFPPLLHGDVRRLWPALAAAVVSAAAYVAVAKFNAMFYFQRAVDFGVPYDAGPSIAPPMTQMPFLVAGLLAAILVAVLAASILTKPFKVTGGLLLFATLTAQLTLNYHLALIGYVAFFVAGWRDLHQFSRRWLAPIVLSGILFAVHYVLLRSTGSGSLRQILGAFVGTPSVWPYINFGQLSYGAASVTSVGLIFALISFAKSRAIADYWLFFILGVLVPVFVVGVFQWYPAPRYTIGCLIPLLMCSFAVVQSAMAAMKTTVVRHPITQLALAMSALVVVVNPVALSRVLHAGYDVNPDHKGAADFMRTLHLQPNDIVLAQDVLMQTFYLGRVSYWLMAKPVAAPFIYKKESEYVDEYTDTKVIGTGAELSALLNQPGRGAIYVIGSGEIKPEERGYFEGEGIEQALENSAFKTLYIGRDKSTRVLVAPPANAPAADAASREALAAGDDRDRRGG